jgi:hypothetical protein
VIVGKEINKYDNHANRVSVKTLLKDSLGVPVPGQIEKGMKVVQLTTYRYDPKNLKTITYYSGANMKTPKRMESFQYDPGENMVEYLETAKGAGKLISIQYDEKKSVVLCEFHNAEGKVIRSVASTYGKNESLAQETDINLLEPDVNKRKRMYKYKYLKDDNISECDVYLGSRRIDKTVYTYEYYK